MLIKTLHDIYPADNMNPLLAKILQGMSPETELFIEVILVFTIFFHVLCTSSIIAKAPAFLTTLGILGTFTGIALGLLSFDPNDVQKSVPALIDGIKTAVWASACGIFCALTIKLRDILGLKWRKKRAKAHSTVDDLAELLEAVEDAVGGDSEESVLGQLKLMRQDGNDHQQLLSQSLDNFYANVAEANTKALVAVLNEVIRDFNTRFNEQFGENFSRFNQAMEKMLAWQESYSKQVGEMIEQQASASKSMDMASERYLALLQQAEAFNAIAGSMSALLAGLETQRTQLDGSLASLASLVNTASTGIPMLETHITEMVRQLGEGVKATNTEFNTNIQGLIEKTKEQVLILDRALSEELSKSLESLGRQLASLSEKFARDYTPITERLQAVLKIAG